MKWLALFTAGCFLVLACYANGRATNWTPSQRAKPVVLYVQHQYDTKGMERLLARVERERVAAVLAKVYGVNDDNMDAYKKWGAR